MRNLTGNLLLLLFASLFAIGAAEIILGAMDLPPEPLQPHSHPPQFRMLPGADFGYVNTPSSDIEFIYDGNPRNYFGPRNEVIHRTNSIGFRGPEFRPEKADGVFRIAFLGDSFTFGEGVRFGDTYPRQVETLLASAGKKVEALNFGVGGFNTRQEAALLHALVQQSSPDLLVLGYTMNDAEPELFYYDKASKRYRRRPRQDKVHEGGATPTPPDNPVFALRLPRLIWQYFASREQTNNTIAWYRSLYAESNSDWMQTRDALADIGKYCTAQNIPCAAVLFPVLYRLNDYPLRDEHERIKQVLQDDGFLVVDLLPVLAGYDAESLRVHPTDHHPNEIVHRLAAQALVERLAQQGLAWPGAGVNEP
jgi:lysophospholipase L1-like esterase